MCVGVHRRRDLAVAEPLLDDLDRDALSEQEASTGVAEVVEPEVREARLRQQPLEVVVERRGVDRPAVDRREDVGGRERQPGRVDLARAMGAERRNNLGWDWRESPAGLLGLDLVERESRAATEAVTLAMERMPDM